MNNPLSTLRRDDQALARTTGRSLVIEDLDGTQEAAVLFSVCIVSAPATPPALSSEQRDT